MKSVCAVFHKVRIRGTILILHHVIIAFVSKLVPNFCLTNTNEECIMCIIALLSNFDTFVFTYSITYSFY